jgi:predicted AAA+ superfamily ATPase
MHVNQIKEVIISQQEEYTEIFKKERIIEREVKKEDLLAALQYPNILVLLGPRRSGKSILSLSLLKEKKKNLDI